MISYVLQFNRFPSGKDELKADPESLKAIVITREENRAEAIASGHRESGLAVVLL